MIVRIIYPAGLIHSSEIIFDLYLEGKYPFQPPKLVCESIFAFPSVSDGRDLTSEILKQKWTPSITSADLISLIPGFFQSNLLKNQSEISVKDYGRFHLGSPYYLESWERKEFMASFYCAEIDVRNKKAAQERIIVLTHTVILVLELNNQYPGIGYLISWATLQSLSLVRRSIKEPETLVFEWKKIEDRPAFSQVFRMNEANSFIELLSKNMQKLGAVVKRLTAKRLFVEDEVNGKEIKKMNINEVLQAIEVYEDNFETVLNKNIINTLLELYQQAIEYFAAINSNQYNVFLKRMHLILSDENVVNVLQGKEVKEIQKEEFVVKSHKIMSEVAEKDLEGNVNLEEEKKIEEPLKEFLNTGAEYREAGLESNEEKKFESNFLNFEKNLEGSSEKHEVLIDNETIYNLDHPLNSANLINPPLSQVHNVSPNISNDLVLNPAHEANDVIELVNPIAPENRDNPVNPPNLLNQEPKVNSEAELI